MSKFNIGKLMTGGLKADIVSAGTAEPNLEMMGKTVNTLFGRDNKSLSPVPARTSNIKSYRPLPDINKEASLVPKSVPRAVDNQSTFAFSDVLAQSTTRQEFETSQNGHSLKNVTQNTGPDGTTRTEWQGVNQEKTSYTASAKQEGSNVEIKARGGKGEFESTASVTKGADGTRRESVNIKNNRAGTETTYRVETKGSTEKHKGTTRNFQGNHKTYECEKSRGQIVKETTRTDFSEGCVEIRETVKDMEKMIDTLYHFSEKHMEEFVGINVTEKEAIALIAKNIKEGKVSTAKIKEEIFGMDEFSLLGEGALLELIEQEFSLSLDKENNPVSSRSKKIYDKEGNLTGEEEEETFYRSGEGKGSDRENVIVRRTYKFEDDKRIQTGEEQFIDFFPISKKKNLQYTRTYFESGKKVYQRTDRIQKGDVSEEYKDLSEIMDTGKKLLFARLLQGKAEEMSIRHHRDVFYSSIETEEREIRSTTYKSLSDPSVLLMRVDLVKGYGDLLPLWVITSSSRDEVNTQFFFEGIKDSTFIDRFDKSTSYHIFKGTLKDHELESELLREASKVQNNINDEISLKIRREKRSHLEYKFADKADDTYQVQTSAWLEQYSPIQWMKKDAEMSASEIIEMINHLLVTYLGMENRAKRELALEKRHSFLPIILTGKAGLEMLLGQKFGLDLIFLIWEMLNITGYPEGKDKFARIKV